MIRVPDRQLRLELPREPARVDADPTRVAQVLSNLLDNALKYSPEGSPVDVHLALEEGLARVSVSDQGPGIPEEDRGRLFTPFERLGGDLLLHPAARRGAHSFAAGRRTVKVLPWPGSLFASMRPWCRAMMP